MVFGSKSSNVVKLSCERKKLYIQHTSTNAGNFWKRLVDYRQKILLNSWWISSIHLPLAGKYSDFKKLVLTPFTVLTWAECFLVDLTSPRSSLHFSSSGSPLLAVFQGSLPQTEMKMCLHEEDNNLVPWSDGMIHTPGKTLHTSILKKRPQWMTFKCDQLRPLLSGTLWKDTSNMPIF